MTYDTDTSIREWANKQIKLKYEQIAELQKENAELKKENAELKEKYDKLLERIDNLRQFRFSDKRSNDVIHWFRITELLSEAKNKG